MFSLPPLLLLGLSAVAVAADWTTTSYDAIIVGAGPAGIIGKYL
jgi:ribulose 1,5-bisphosphate synthetase/thiazole synthase